MGNTAKGDPFLNTIGKQSVASGDRQTYLAYRMLITWQHRLEKIRQKVNGRVRIVLHGTNDFPEDVMQRCIRGGVSKVNVNKLVLDDYLVHLKQNSPTDSLTMLMEKGVSEIRKLVEWQMDVTGSAGRA